MWNLLRNGVEVLKHGRRGNPKFKTLLCDVNLTKLYWRSPGSKADPDMDNLPEDLRHYPTLTDPTAGVSALAKGASTDNDAVHSTTAAAAAANHKHKISAFGTKSNVDRVLYIRDIVEVNYVLIRNVKLFYVEKNAKLFDVQILLIFITTEC
jgi:hypothetical protein